MENTARASALKLKNELEDLLRRRMAGQFRRYGLDLEKLLTPFKWKSLVLIIGNYSSGKSTLINEFLGRNVQSTGQSPTDDGFTILSSPDTPEGGEREVPGPTVINDPQLPFAPLRRFGSRLIAHLRLKEIETPLLPELALIDTPGMLDSVTEKDRGYDYLGVVGELARLADLIILMFDPYKAGTIKETYQAIRSTLPATSGPGRTLFVLNRIDECDNLKDLLRAYGTLCWNLSQMTGRKDMPRIFLTFAPEGEHARGALQDRQLWASEREELKKAIASAPRLRLDHVLQDVDRAVRELRLQVAALARYQEGFLARLKRVLRVGFTAAGLAFLFGDAALKLLAGTPGPVFAGGLLAGNLQAPHWVCPVGCAMAAVVLSYLDVQYLLHPRYLRHILGHLDELAAADTDYERDLWQVVRGRVRSAITGRDRTHLWMRHRRNLRRIDAFLGEDLRRIYQRLRTAES
ncbi:MAG: dynamin family protein [Desulfobacteraceae bacterium]|nr:dynamin family protein [Desulfobacteraceae bacterium]